MSETPSHDTQTIDGAWGDFCLAALPPGVSLTEREQLRLAFYAGAHFAYSALTEASERGSDAGARQLDRLAEELGDWLLGVGARR